MDDWLNKEMDIVQKQLDELKELFKQVPDPFEDKKPKLTLIKGGKYGT